MDGLEPPRVLSYMVGSRQEDDMFTVADLRERAKDPRELLRASRTLGEDRLLVSKIDGAHLAGTAQGSSGELYELQLDSWLAGRCTCEAWKRSGDRQFCKHLGAAAIWWLRRNGAPTGEQELDPALAAAVDALSTPPRKNVTRRA